MILCTVIFALKFSPCRKFRVRECLPQTPVAARSRISREYKLAFVYNASLSPRTRYRAFTHLCVVTFANQLSGANSTSRESESDSSSSSRPSVFTVVKGDRAALRSRPLQFNSVSREILGESVLRLCPRAPGLLFCTFRVRVVSDIRIVWPLVSVYRP